MKSSKQFKLSIGAIFKNEGPYIIEWIAAHRVIGIDEIIIANNNSDDGSLELLTQLSNKGVIKLIDYPGEENKPPQLSAYTKIMHDYGGGTDWIAFIDADEFLLPTNGKLTIRDAFNSIAEDVSIGAVAVNWVVFGSSGEMKKRPGLVLERFKMRANQHFLHNHHYKSIVRCSAFLGAHGNPHLFKIKPEFKYVHTDGTEVSDHPERGPGLSDRVVWEEFRLHHYVIKSKEEFDIKKKPKGSATVIGRNKGDGYFKSHDQNDVSENIAEALLELIQKEVILLEKLIPTSVLKKVMRMPKIPIHLKRHGYVDRLNIKGTFVYFTGWSYLLGEQAEILMKVLIGEASIPIQFFKRLERPDVKRKIPELTLSCGFEIGISILDIPASALDRNNWSITVFAEDKLETVEASAKCLWPVENIRELIEKSPSIPNIPSMPNACIQYLKEQLQASSVYLEYGSGGSTVLAALTSLSTMVSVESDASWLDAVNHKVHSLKKASTQYIPLYIDIGLTKEWGFPVSTDAWQNYWKYAIHPWIELEKNHSKPDLILIDGRFRVACFLASLYFSKPKSTILFDDYSERTYYHSIEKFIKPATMIERMGVFIVPEVRPMPLELVASISLAMTDAR